MAVPRRIRDMRVVRLAAAARALTRKNRCIQNRPDHPAREGRVNLEEWVSPFGEPCNLGDSVSRVIVEWMLARRGLRLDQPVGQTQFLTAVGSILDNGANDCTVWGTGLLRERPSVLVRPRHRRLDLRAVRGPRTAQVLRSRGFDCPDVFGDPAVLLPLIYPARRGTGESGPLLAHHMRDAGVLGEGSFSMMTDDYAGFVDLVCDASVVVTTSLHGIIFAESYGVPAVLVRSDRPDFSLFKYEDWYWSTGRTAFPVAKDAREALSVEPAPLPELDDMRQGLMDAFPYDLWA